MKFWFIFFSYCLCFLVLGWGFNIINTEVHENAHSAVFGIYNITSNITINWFSGKGYTIPNQKEYHLYCNDSCKMMHSLNEVFGYNMSTLMFAMMCTAYLIGLMLIAVVYMRKEEDRDVYYEKIIEELTKQIKQQPPSQLSPSPINPGNNLTGVQQYVRNYRI